MGLIFTALALVVQSFAVFQPPEAANASSSADFVRGGVSSIDDFLDDYDENKRNIKDLFNSLGITRAEIKAADSDTVPKSSNYYNWSMTSLYSKSQGQESYKFYDKDGDSHKVYNRPMTLTQEGRAPYPVFEGYSSKFGWFAIKKDCGNLITKKQPPDQEKPRKPAPPTVVRSAACRSLAVRVVQRENVQLTGSALVQNATVVGYTFTVKDSTGKTIKRPVVRTSQTTAQPDSFKISKPGRYKAYLTVSTSLGNRTSPTACVKAFTIAAPEVCPYNSSLPATDVKCQPCPDSDTPNLWIDSPECKEEFLLSKRAVNVDQSGSAAASLLAQASDRIRYTVSVENRGHTTGRTTITENLEDVLQYASLVDRGGGTFDPASKTLTWSDVAVQAGKTEPRTFTVQLASSIPSMNTGVSDGSSYDCKMTNTFGNSIEIAVNCPIQKLAVEQVVEELPETGPRENMMFAGIVLAIVTYFYARARQLGKEVRLVRKDLNAGVI